MAHVQADVRQTALEVAEIRAVMDVVQAVHIVLELAVVLLIEHKCTIGVITNIKLWRLSMKYNETNKPIV